MLNCPRSKKSLALPLLIVLVFVLNGVPKASAQVGPETAVNTGQAGTGPLMNTFYPPCYGNGYYWVFYDKSATPSTGFNYVSSATGTSWSSGNAIPTAGYPDFASEYCNGTDLFYATGASMGTGTTGAGTVYYRNATLGSSGTLSYLIPEKSFSTTNPAAEEPVISVDTNGNMWVAVQTDASGTFHIEVWEYSSHAWAKSDDITVGASQQGFQLIPLSGGDMALIYGAWFAASVTNIVEHTTSWSSPVATAATYLLPESEAAVGIGTTVYDAAVNKATNNLDFLTFTLGGASWAVTSDLIASAGSYVTISTDGTADLYICYIPSSTTVDYIKSTNSGSSWGAAQTVSTGETSAELPDATLVADASSIQFVWTDTIASAFVVRWYAVTTPSSSVSNTYQATPTAQTTWDSGLTNSLVGYWPMDEGTGTTTADFSGKANTGTLTNGPTWASGASCKFGSCLSFASASTQYVSVATTSGLPSGSSSISAFGWFYITSTATSQEIFSYGAGTGSGQFDLFVYTNGQMYNSFSGPTSLFTSTPLNQWDFGGLVYASGSSAVTFYLNGQSQLVSLSGPFNIAAASALRIGYQTANQYPINGKIDDVRFYSSALSSVQVSALYAATSPATLVNGVEVYGTVNGVTNSAICGIPVITGGGGAETCTGTSDSGTTVYMGPTSIGGAPANAQWVSNGQCSFAPTTGGNTESCDYYKQWTNGFLYSNSGGGSITAPTLSCNEYGSTATLSLTTASQSFYCDNGATASATTPTTGSSSSERWSDNSQAFTVSSGGSIDTFSYYHQFTATSSYSGSVASGGAPSLKGTEFGVSGVSTTLTTTPSGVWLDSGTGYALTKPAADFPSATERYDTGFANGTVSSATTLDPVFYHQFKVTPSGITSFSCAQFGASSSGLTTAYFCDSGSSLSSVGTSTVAYGAIAGASFVYQPCPDGTQLLLNVSASASSCASNGISLTTPSASLVFFLPTTGSLSKVYYDSVSVPVLASSVTGGTLYSGKGEPGTSSAWSIQYSAQPAPSGEGSGGGAVQETSTSTTTVAGSTTTTTSLVSPRGAPIPANEFSYVVFGLLATSVFIILVSRKKPIEKDVDKIKRKTLGSGKLDRFKVEEER